MSQVVLVVKNRPANAGGLRDMGLLPGLGRSPGGGRSNSVQYFYLENPMDRGPGGLQSMRSQRATKHSTGKVKYTRKMKGCEV